MKKLFLLVVAMVMFSMNMNAQDIQNNSFKLNNDWPDLMMRRYVSGDMVWKRALVAQSSTILAINYNNNFTDGVRIMGKAYFTSNVGIGTNHPDSRLTVKGKIHCEEVKVDLSVPADYVFEKYYTGDSELNKDYVMPTLEEVEAYTKENKHLPEIPSAQEIKDNGLKLKEMTNLLLQKIEELTLYTIEQEKRIKALEAKLAAATEKTETE